MVKVSAMVLNTELLFDSDFYVSTNPDVAAAIAKGETDSLSHFERFGQVEGRNPSVFFNTQFYLAQNPDVSRAISDEKIESAFAHYLQFGQFERRPPIPQFDENVYLDQNPDVALALAQEIFTSGYEHYVRHGKAEGRALNLQVNISRSELIIANFVDSQTDEKLKQGVSRTGGQVPELPYGVLPTDLGIDFDRINERQVKLFSVPPTVISPVIPLNTPAKTWVIIHGWNDNPDDRSDSDPQTGNRGDFTDIAEALANANSNDTVLLLDWRQAAAGGKINQEDNNLNSLLKLGNYTAAKWIRPVAEFTVKALESFGIQAENALTQLNLIGHSLGSLLGNEIARIYKDGALGQNISGNGVGVNALIALDPPSQMNLSLFSTFISGIGYDIDGRTPEVDFVDPGLGIYVPKFSEVSNFSRAFVGSRSLAGNQLFAEQADESIQLDFGTRVDLGEEHGWVVQNFKNLIDDGSQLGEIGKLFEPTSIAQLLTPSPSIAQNSYTNSIGGKHDGSLVVKRPESILELPQPIALIFKNISGDDDDLVYGTAGNDILDSSNTAFLGGDSRYSASGNDIFYGDAGDDRILSGSGNDTIEGSLGRDTINGEQDRDRISGGLDEDYIFGGKGEDLIFGDENNDTLEGNNDNDTVLGGQGEDRIWGGGDNGADYIHGGSGNDRLTGEGGSDTLIGGDQNDRLEGNNEDDILIGGMGQDVMSGGSGRDTFVFAPGDGSSTVSGADTIEDFRSGILVTFGSRTRVGDVRGVSQIGLTGGLTGDRIKTEKLGNDTILRSNTEVLAILKNVDVRQNELIFV